MPGIKYGSALLFMQSRIMLVCMIESPAKIIEDLRAAGLRDAHIAARCGAGQPTIWRIRRGKTRDPRLSVVRALVDLHASVCGPQAERQSDAAA